MSTEFDDLKSIPFGYSPLTGVLYNSVATKLNKPRVLGVLAGQDFPAIKLMEWAASADRIVAADGGANFLAKVGVTPASTVGDLDSIESESVASQLELIHISDQDTSDCDKLLAFEESRGNTSLTLICIEGDLLDHVLGSLFSAAKSGLEIRLVLRRGIGHILRGPTNARYSVPEATRLSLMPLTSCSGVNLTGCEWPLKNANLTPDGSNSLSNVASGTVSVDLENGIAILILAHPKLEVPHWD